MADNIQIEKLIKKLSERTGKSESEIQNAVQNADYSRLLGNMEPSQAAKLKEVLGDENAARQFLSSPQAKALLKRLMS